MIWEKILLTSSYVQTYVLKNILIMVEVVITEASLASINFQLKKYPKLLAVGVNELAVAMLELLVGANP